MLRISIDYYAYKDEYEIMDRDSNNDWIADFNERGECTSSIPDIHPINEKHVQDAIQNIILREDKVCGNWNIIFSAYAEREQNDDY